MKTFEELAEAINRLKPFTQENYPYANASWLENLECMKREFFSNDIFGLLKFPTLQKTMFVGDCEAVDQEYDQILSDSNYETKWKFAMMENELGCPKLYHRNYLYSGNTIHQTYHLMMYEKRTGVDVLKSDYVFEFGGGYGNMCKIFRNMNFKGRYIIYDLDFFNLIQNYYLSSLGMIEGKDFDCVSSLDDLSAISTNFTKQSLFISTWALNEVPVSLREEILKNLDNVKNYLLAYNFSFEGVNNIEYFESFKNRFPKITWDNLIIETLKHSYYLFGHRKWLIY